ncbi:MAG TPA: response regulator [Ktedonobacterales bacterium]
MAPFSDPPASQEGTGDNQSAAPRPPGKPWILLLEDNPDQADPLAAILRLSGYQCHVAYTKDEAHALLAQAEPTYALMIADVRLTRAEDITFVTKARATPRYSALPIIVLTGMGAQEARARAQALSVSEYLIKPTPAATLLPLIQRWIATKHP